MFPHGSSLIRLSSNYKIKPFDCGDKDLNDFLLNDAKLLAVAYILETKTQKILKSFHPRILVNVF